MATQALYRRYRPRRFSEVKGQDHVVSALRNAVINGREGQAYLFSGPRGTGKTTSARILAKVLNCEQPEGGEPCCACASCLAVEQGTSYDVHELDAASNNGVDAMRDLIEKASLGTPGRHRVYILDEVHMLSKGAEAALLKTLEEPPPHVVFVLATTDPHKVSDTIRSRTQHLQFHLLPMDVLEDHVRWLAGDAGIELPDQALRSVVQRGGGSARDTISALELAAATGGLLADHDSVDDVVEALIDQDAGRALTFVAHAVQLGRDPRTLAEDIIRHLRNCFLSLMAPELVQLPADRADEVAGQATRLGAASTVRAMERLGTMLVEMRHAPDPRLLVEVALVQLTHRAAGGDTAAVMARLDAVEKSLEAVRQSGPALAAAPVDPATGRTQLGGRARTPQTPAAPQTPAPTPTPSPSPSPSLTVPSSPSATPAEAGAAEPSQHTSATSESAPPEAPAPAPADQSGVLATYEHTVRPALRGMAKAMFMGGKAIEAGDGALVIAFPGEPHRNRAAEYRADVEKAMAAEGHPVTLELIVDGAVHAAAVAADDGDDSGNVVPLRAAAAPADDEVDTSDLVDVPPEAVVTPLDRVLQVFPGSTDVTERS
jgi:DNA polymerase III subunit gamma/tau